ncbi:MAG: type II toxin-antitoxin system HicA family toxin [Chloroflexi bacterium]|nr:type II toxin-antitoxin system HicA family toxin [Chloroflexota bacterium]
MSQRLTPVKRRVLIQRLKRLGWEGPYLGGDHAYMKKEAKKIPIPNDSEIDVGLLRRIMDEAGITREEWFSAK